ncbi:aryl hydrocarbon receptor-like isoform X2 [Trichomycterus rosablanca]|uniref:aryl hydrocarbon receptor-like isoform X2 n=1 Tax=Trichomycterus rosablanca TaxID=2290929 RepID=UPI002F35A774
MLDTDRYAGKKRKKPVQKHKPANDVTKTNPSKRHRDRLNSELDRLNDMLPFHENVCSRLDKLSILRLSVGYLKVKNFFKATMKKNTQENASGNSLDPNQMDAVGFSEGDLLLQALNGFVLVVTAEGYVFYASPTIQDYLGFHQSDMVHQSVFEFIHVDDRAMFRRQLHFALNPNLTDVEHSGDETQNSSDITRNIVAYDPQDIPPENSSFLERSFVCQFRCLLDNSSGFLKLNFQGRLKFLHGQQSKTEDGSPVQPQLALFAIATPVQPPAIVEIRTKTLIFQTKHKLDFTPLGIDSRGKVVLGYTEMELCMRGSGYQFIHAADMMYCADSHVKMIKTGESGMTVFRLLTKNGGWVWVQANARLVYKEGRPDFIIARQRALVNAEGEEHLRKRSMQLPFSFTTGEAVLYDTCPTLDVMTSTSNKIDQSTSHPSSLISSIESQDKSIYKQNIKPQFTVDDAFRDSWALFNVPNQASQRQKSTEDGDTVMSVMDALEQLAHDGDLCSALQQMEVDSAELKDWENAILRMTKHNNGNDTSFSLNEILTNDIFSYVEDALYKENNKSSVPQTNPGISVKPEAFGGHFSAVRYGCDFPDYNLVKTRLDTSNVKAEMKLDSGMTGQEMISEGLCYTGSSNMGISIPGSTASLNNVKSLPNFKKVGWFADSSKDLQSQKCGFKVGSTSTPPNPSFNGWERLKTPENGRNKSSTASYYQFGSEQNNFHYQRPPTDSDWNKMVLGTENHTDSLSPSKNCESPDMNSISPRSCAFPQQIQSPQQWQNPLPEQLCSSPIKNRFESQFCYQTVFSLVDHSSESSHNYSDESNNSVNSVYHSAQNSLSPDQCSPLSSCMFESHSPVSTNADQQQPRAQAVTISSCGKKTIPENQSPPEAACYFHWLQNEPVVGSSSVPHTGACGSPSSSLIGPGVDSHSVLQRYLSCSGHVQVETCPVEDNGPFSCPLHVRGQLLQPPYSCI